MKSSELVKQITTILEDKKASRLKVLCVHDLTVMADYLVIACGTSTTHVKSLAEEVEFKMKEQHQKAPLRTEGFQSQNWLVLDYANVIVHVFAPDARDFYDLEHLWADAQDVTQEFVEEETN